MKEKSAIALHAYGFSYKRQELSPHGLAVIYKGVSLLNKTNLFLVLGGLTAGQEKHGLICNASTEKLSKLAPKVEIIKAFSNYDPTTKEIRNVLQKVKEHKIDILYLPMLITHIPRTLWHYWWIMREMGIRVKIIPKPIYIYKNWFRRLIWDILATPKSLIDPLAKKSKPPSEKLFKLFYGNL